MAEVAPGERILFETQDAQAGRVQSHADALAVILPPAQANPVTGPVYVTGAQPGDTLAVRILEIRLGARGLGRTRPGRGILGDTVRRPTAQLIPVHEGWIQLTGEGSVRPIRFPVRPMVGTIGTAPSGESIPSFYPGPHGGNLDVNAVAPGATVYLPVAVPGALLALGDVHASMGAGELTGGGIDIPAEVLVEVELVHRLGWKRPVVQTADEWCTCASAATLPEAIRLAALDMTRLLAERLGLSHEESYILIGAAGDARVGQAAQVGIDMTAYLCISKAILPTAF